MSIDLNVRDGETVSLDVSGGAARRTEENIEDIVGALVTGGTNVTATYDDGADTLTIDTSALNEEEVEDAVAALLSAGNAISLTYNDPGDTLTVAVDESALSFYDGTNLTADVDNEAVTTEDADITGGAVIGDYHHASRYDGADGDARLTNALSAASEGDTIYLENLLYEDDRTITQDKIALVGTGRGGGGDGQGSDLIGTWTFNSTRGRIENLGGGLGVAGESGAITFNGFQLYRGGYGGDITVSGDSVIITEMFSGTVTFQSGTSGGIVDASSGVTVTDNGTNTVGDVG